jgi:hypothetical protein
MSKRPWMFTLGFALLAALLGGCVSHEIRSLPYDAWSLDFFTPDYMEVWIETADAVDINEHVFRGAGSGIPAMGYPRAMSKGVPSEFRGKPAGWGENPGGKGRYVTGADLPRLVYVRWQSTAEPQTYEAYIEIPQSARNTMLKGEEAFCGASGKWKTDYRKFLTVGLAPGGIAKVWVGGPCLNRPRSPESKARLVQKAHTGASRAAPIIPFRRSPKPTSTNSVFPMEVGKEYEHFRWLNAARLRMSLISMSRCSGGRAAAYRLWGIHAR